MFLRKSYQRKQIFNGPNGVSVPTFGHGGLVLDGTTPTGAWSFSRDLKTSFIGGSRYTDVAGEVSALNDQSGNSRNLSQSNAAFRPTITTAGTNSRTCADFASASGDRLTGTTLSNFIANNSGYAVVSILADSIVTNSATVYANHAIICDGVSQIFGLFLRNTGTPDTVYAYNWDGSVDAASSATINAGTTYVVEWKHTGGNVSVRVNAGSWTDVASGNTTGLGGTFTMGTQSGASSTSFDGKIFEAAIYSSLPTTAQQDAIAADFKNWIGA